MVDASIGVHPNLPTCLSGRNFRRRSLRSCSLGSRHRGTLGRSGRRSAGGSCRCACCSCCRRRSRCLSSLFLLALASLLLRSRRRGVRRLRCIGFRSLFLLRLVLLGLGGVRGVGGGCVGRISGFLFLLSQRRCSRQTQRQAEHGCPYKQLLLECVHVLCPSLFSMRLPANCPKQSVGDVSLQNNPSEPSQDHSGAIQNFGSASNGAVNHAKSSAYSQ